MKIKNYRELDVYRMAMDKKLNAVPLRSQYRYARSKRRCWRFKKDVWRITTGAPLNTARKMMR